MSKEIAHIFIDEFGTNIYLPDNSTTTTHFVYTSFIVSESNLEKAKEVRNNLSKKYKQGSVLSSKTFDKKDKNDTLQKRIDFINELVKSLDFTIDLLKLCKNFIKVAVMAFETRIALAFVTEAVCSNFARSSN